MFACKRLNISEIEVEGNFIHSKVRDIDFVLNDKTVKTGTLRYNSKL